MPADWAGERVDLLLARATARRRCGSTARSVQGLNSGTGSPRRPPRRACSTRARAAGERLACAIEIACNGMFGAARPRRTRSLEPVVLDRCEIARFDQRGVGALPTTSTCCGSSRPSTPTGLDPRARRASCCAELNRFCNVWRADDRGDLGRGARRCSTALYAHDNGSDGHEIVGDRPRAHRHRLAVAARGDATASACAPSARRPRTWTSYPEYRFACSQAQQYAWIKERNPDLYERIQRARRARASSSRSAAPGSSPTATSRRASRSSASSCSASASSSASSAAAAASSGTPTCSATTASCRRSCAARASTASSRRSCRGTASTSPSTTRSAGRGSTAARCSTHFPPADTYNGAGDGRGAAPQRARLQGSRPLAHEPTCSSATATAAAARRRDDARDAAPRRRPAGRAAHRRSARASEFFDRRSSASRRPARCSSASCTSSTTAAPTRSRPRSSAATATCELLLHDVELLAALAHWRGLQQYPRRRARRGCGETLLPEPVPRHHPGLVDRRGLRGRAPRLRRDRARRARRCAARRSLRWRTARPSAPLNTLGVERRGVVVDARRREPASVAAAVRHGHGRRAARRRSRSRALDGDGWRARERAPARASSIATGRLRRARAPRERPRGAARRPATCSSSTRTRPIDFEAWDVDPFHLETRAGLPAGARRARRHVDAAARRDRLRAPHRRRRRTGTQRIRLDADAQRARVRTATIDWREAQKILKVRFPVDVRSPNATYEMQFGAVERPTHYTTSTTSPATRCRATASPTSPSTASASRS